LIYFLFSGYILQTLIRASSIWILSSSYFIILIHMSGNKNAHKPLVVTSVGIIIRKGIG